MRPMLRAILGVSMATLTGAMAFPSPTAAQFPGQRASRGYAVQFETSGQGMWGAGPAQPGATYTVPLFNESWDESNSDNDIQTFYGERFGGSAWGSIAGSTAMRVILSEATTGSVGLRYPFEPSFTFPAPNAFARGTEIVITSAWTAGAGAQVTSTEVAFQADVRGHFDIDANVGATVCVFSCSGNLVTGFPAGFATGDQLLARLAPAGPPIPGFPIDGLPHTFNLVEEIALGMAGTVGIPRVNGTSSTLNPDGSLSAFGQTEYFDVDLDLFTWAVRFATGGLPLKKKLAIGVGAAALNFSLVDMLLGLQLTMDQAFTFTPNPRTSLTFPEAVAWRERTPAGQIIATGNGTTADFAVGNDLLVTFPAHRAQPLAAAPTFALPNKFGAEMDHRTTGQFQERIGDLDFDLGAQSWTEDIGEYVTSTVCTATSWIPLLGKYICTASEEVTNWVEDIVNRASNAIAFETGWWVNETQPLGEAVDDLFDGSWELGGIAPIAVDAFALDPEDPIIAVASSVENTLLKTGAGAGTVTQTYVVENQGDVALNATQVADAVAAQYAGTGLTAEAIGSASLTVNGAFNGRADPQTLGGGDVLPVGGTGMVEIVWQAPAGNVYDLALTAEGTSPIGTPVTATAASQFGVYAMDVRPLMLDTLFDDDDDEEEDEEDEDDDDDRIRVRLHGTTDLDVRRIDRQSVRLEGVTPARIRVRRRRGHRFLEAQFSRKELIPALLARVNNPPDFVPLVGPVATVVAAPGAVELRTLAEHVLGGVDVATSVARQIDGAGNGNGRLDIGDLRAQWLAERAPRGVTVVAASADGRWGRRGGGDDDDDEDDDDGPRGRRVMTVLTGTMDDATPLWAEAMVYLTREDD